MQALGYSACKDKASDLKLRSTSAALPHVQCAIRVMLPLASLLAYAILVLNLHQSLVPQSYNIERDSIAVAVSHLVYGAPPATEFAGLRTLFTADDLPLPDKLAVATQRKIAPGGLLLHTPDGLGVGYPLYVTAAMRVFGIRTIALAAGFLCLEGLAALVFLLKFHDDRALIVGLYFFALSAILATPIGTDPFLIGQIPVGGYRCFSLLAVMPALHISLDLIDESPNLPPLRRTALLSLQALLLTGAYIINGSVVYVALPLSLIAIAVAILRRKNKDRFLSAIKKSRHVIAVVLVTYLAFYAVAREHYRQSGHIGDLFWHRIFISYGVNPAWPFGNLSETYSVCKKAIPRGLVPGFPDQNGHCVWDAYAIQKSLSLDAILDGLYGSEYEKVMRGAFFKVLFAYPREAIQTFLFYKPLMIIDTLSILLKPNPAVGLLRETVLIAQGLLLAGFAFFGVTPSPAGRLAFMAGVLALFGASTLPLYIAAWSSVITTSDLICYLFMLAGLLLVTVVASVRAAAALWRRRCMTGTSTASA